MIKHPNLNNLWALDYSRVLLFFNTSFLQLGSEFGNTLKSPSNNTVIQTPIRTRFGILNPKTTFSTCNVEKGGGERES